MRYAFRGGLLIFVVGVFTLGGPYWTMTYSVTGHLYGWNDSGELVPGGIHRTRAAKVPFWESDLWGDLKLEFDPGDPATRRPDVRYPTDLFTWGIYQPDGWAVLVVSTAVSLAAFSGCVLLVWRAANRVGYRRAGLVLGVLALCPMVVWCGESVSMQLTSVNYTRAHRDALVVLAGTVLTVGVVAGVIELTTRGRTS